MKKFGNLFLLLAFLSGMPVAMRAQVPDQQECFQYVFGDKVKLDPAMVKKVGADLSGKRYYVDQNKDGKPEEVWFVDIDPRHTEAKRPILVRAIDRNGDLQMGGQADYNSDLYVVDYNADGKVDAVVSYEDLDGDGDVDRMGIFYYDKTCGLRVWWSRDDGDDNLLWYTIDYAYCQNQCEQRNNFGGDETFDMFYIKPGDKQWTGCSENPFCFFDRDGDGLTEEVIRVVGEGNTIRSIRWSFDADNNATAQNPRDYDVSLTAMVGNGKADIDNEKVEGAPLSYGDDVSETVMIEGYPAKMLKRNAMTSYLQKQIWSREILTWGEDNLNIAYRVPGYTIPRWEGVIASASTEKGAEMPRIGWPDCGPVNKRYEVITHPKAENQYYYCAGDKRIHLKGCDKAWMKVDFDYDTKVDMNYEWKDTNKDGVVDKLFIDTDGDGKWNDSYSLDTSDNKEVKWNFQSINSAFSGVVAQEPQRLFTLNQLLKEALQAKGAYKEDAAWKMIEGKFQCKDLAKESSQRLLNSDETMLYFLRICVDRQLVQLEKAYSNKPFWKQIESLRGKGQTNNISALVAKQFGLKMASASDYTAWLQNLRKPEEVKHIAWNNNWWAPNWGWESEKAAFRCYDGHFDLFGKRYDYLVLPTLTKDIRYHNDFGTWGMDILHVGPTGGCGGLTLFVNGKAYYTRHDKDGDPVWTPRLVQESKDSVTIGFTVTGVGPKDAPYTVYINCTARAGHFEDMRDVKVEGGKPGDDIQLGVVINKIPTEDFFIDKKAGVMGLWGFQDPAMGWIGMGVMFPAQRYVGQSDNDVEHCALLNIIKGEWLRFYAQGDWLRGHRFVPGGGAKEWRNTLLKSVPSLNFQ